MVPVLNEFREPKYGIQISNTFKVIIWGSYTFIPVCSWCSQYLQRTFGQCLQNQCLSHTKTAVASLLFGRTNIQWTLKYPKYPLLVVKCHSSETSKCPLIPSAIVSSLGPCGMPKNPATKKLISGSKSESFRTLLYLFWLICVLPCLLLNILNITPNAEFHIAFPPQAFYHTRFFYLVHPGPHFLL